MIHFKTYSNLLVLNFHNIISYIHKNWAHIYSQLTNKAEKVSYVLKTVSYMERYISQCKKNSKVNNC